MSHFSGAILAARNDFKVKQSKGTHWQVLNDDYDWQDVKVPTKNEAEVESEGARAKLHFKVKVIQPADEGGKKEGDPCPDSSS